MRLRASGWARLKAGLAGLALVQVTHAQDPAAVEGHELLWADEFDGTELAQDRWRASESGPWRAGNVRVADGAVWLKAAVEPNGERVGGEIRTGKFYDDRFERLTLRPPVRLELRFRPVMKPGSFVALWLMHAKWNTERYAAEGMMVGKEFDFLECGGGENVVAADDIQVKAHLAVHAWRAPSPWVPDGHRSSQVNMAPLIPVGWPESWQELRVDWDDDSRPGGKEIRYYWRQSGEEWGEPRLRLRPEREFFGPQHSMNQLAFGDVRHVDLLREVWNEPMHLILFHHARPPGSWLAQERLAAAGQNTWGGEALDPADFPVELPIDYVRAYVPAGAPRLP